MKTKRKKERRTSTTATTKTKKGQKREKNTRNFFNEIEVYNGGVYVSIEQSNLPCGHYKRFIKTIKPLTH